MKTTRCKHWSGQSEKILNDTSLVDTVVLKILNDLRDTEILIDRIINPYARAHFTVLAVEKLKNELQKRYGFSPNTAILAEFFVKLVQLLNKQGE